MRSIHDLAIDSTEPLDDTRCLLGERDTNRLRDRRGEPLQPTGPARVRTLRALWDIFDAALAPTPTHRPSVREFVDEVATVFGDAGLRLQPPPC